MMTSASQNLVAPSQAFCRELTRAQARNFYYGLKLLPEPKRSAMYALYAWMRLADDIADDDTGARSPEQRLADLALFQAQTHGALTARGPWRFAEGDPRVRKMWPAFTVLVTRNNIPHNLFDEMIAGQRQDLRPTPIRTFQDLYDYCYRVASVVGLASLHVWGFEGGKETEKLAIDRGIAFQLTNILRDLREDSAKGRCYLPEEDLSRFGVTREGIGEGRVSTGLLELLQFEAARAEEYYERSATLEEYVTSDSRPTLRAMTGIYHGILRKIARRPQRVLTGRVRLSAAAKVLIAWRALRGGR